MKESKYSSFRNVLPVQNVYFLGEIISAGIDAMSREASDNKTKKIAEENLEYQRERNAIEDARYEEETAYNRAFAEDERAYQRGFAEDERAYQRALQQQIFEREDTALERQANSLSKLGINPLAQQLNGLGAGQAISSSSAPSASVEPSTSSRGGNALHNQYNPSETFMNYVTPLLSFANTLNNLNTGGFQRDLLREQVDAQRLKNQEQEIINERLANKLTTEQEQREEDLRHSKTSNPHSERDIESKANRNQREDMFQRDYGALDNSPREMRWASESAYQADRFLNTGKKVVGDVANSATEVLADNAKRALNSYNKATKKAQDWIVGKGRKIKNWFKSKTASPDEVRNMYGY